MINGIVAVLKIMANGIFAVPVIRVNANMDPCSPLVVQGFS